MLFQQRTVQQILYRFKGRRVQITTTLANQRSTYIIWTPLSLRQTRSLLAARFIINYCYFFVAVLLTFLYLVNIHFISNCGSHASLLFAIAHDMPFFYEFLSKLTAFLKLIKSWRTSKVQPYSLGILMWLLFKP